MSNILKIIGIDLATAGDIDADGHFESIVEKDTEKFSYKKLVIKDNILSGCILYGDISGYKKILKSIDERRDISKIRENLEKWDLSVL